jgi:hypothetical protein
VTRYTCCDELRRNAVAASATLNGIDYLEVLDGDAPAGSPRQQTLLVRCLKPVPALNVENVQLTGGERVRDVKVQWVAVASAPPVADTSAAEQAFFTGLPDADHVLVVRTTSYGDYSPYTLRLRRSAQDERAPASFDPRLVEVTFSFKVECPSDFDCDPAQACPMPAPAMPEIDYLAKDYASFRRLMLDRIGQLVPDWNPQTPADVGVTLVELTAYAADHLSYWQDAVATEAYLETARRRTSLRRHALLVDYVPHEGCNARVWIQLRLAEGVAAATIPLRGLRFLSRVPQAPPRLPTDPTTSLHRDAMDAKPTVFEPLDTDGRLLVDDTSQVSLVAAHDALPFYAWGDRRCCLPAGATSATLRGHFAQLQPGQVLVFEEVVGPATGEREDADPAHRHAVRLTSVRSMDPDPDPPGPPVPLRDPLTSELITEIEWAAADALPFPVCISARTDPEHGSQFIDDVSVARGNIVLADHGLTVRDESLGIVPAPTVWYPNDANADRCTPTRRIAAPVRFRPSLQQSPLTHAATIEKFLSSAQGRPTRVRVAFDPAAPAAHVFAWRGVDVQPVARLTSVAALGPPAPPENWDPRRDLLSSDDADRHFVVESEHDGTAFIRFGDDHHGRRPEEGTAFAATYRTGQGLAGNVGHDTIAHVVTDDVRIAGVRNPLSARGGSEPESPDQIRRRAPQAFRTQERAVTPEDYAEVAGRLPAVQRAAATPRWTGSWHTMFVTVDRVGGQPMGSADKLAAESFVEPFRMAGHDVAFNDPVHVPLEIDVTVCVRADHFRSHVHAALLDVLGTRTLSDGRRGMFHPDAFTFGQPVYLSPIYAAIRGVAGVETAEITRFHRQGRPDAGRALRSGVMRLNRLEIARLDNDRNFPERGVLRLALHGGK